MRLYKSPNGLWVVLGITFSLASSCRTTLRPETAAADLLTVDILLTQMRDQDQNRAELMYTLSGCGEGTTTGFKGTNNIVQFQTLALRKDDQCDLKIQSGNSSLGPAKWSADEGLMYEARRIKIKSNEGKLSGVAVLQQMYIPDIGGTPGTAIWKMNAGVIAPKALVPPCTCKIGCDPAIDGNVANMDIDSSATKGLCQFANFAKQDLAKTNCLKMEVQCGADFFVGAWSNPVPVDGSTANVQTLPDLTLQSGIPEQTSDTTIEVIVPH